MAPLSCAAWSSRASVAISCPRSDGNFRLLYHRLDAGNHLVDRGLDRRFFAHDPVHGLGPNVLIVEDGELVVPREFERDRASHKLVVHRLAMRVLLPERALLRRL